MIRAGLGRRPAHGRSSPSRSADLRDLWQPRPADLLVERGAELPIVVDASPWHRGKVRRRVEILVETANRTERPVLYVNQVGGQDGLVFEGSSMLVHPHVGVTWQAPAFEEHVSAVSVDLGPATIASKQLLTGRGVPLTGRGADEFPSKCGPAELWSALVLGLRDYLTKNGFGSAVLGVSGGIDSSVVATLAADALGPEASSLRIDARRDGGEVAGTIAATSA